jgi:N-acetylated-alpha-linked acidic dipeptidase
LGLGYKGVKYNVGPSPDDFVLNLVNEQEYVTTPMWDVIGIINGTLADEVIVVGNHRDAWIAGGAGDPNSGSAALNEVVRSFGEALKLGWKPLRTIVFASWDGEEYGLVGSTEWVEEYMPWLSKASVAYVNMDVACSGPVFKVSASPPLNNIIYEVTGMVLSPNQTVPGQTVRDVWDGQITTMGSGSDFTAFQDHAGIPSIDMGFAGDNQSPVYHYHSNYDSFHWMATYGDPGFHYHATAAKILALFTAKLAETPVIPLNITDYSSALKDYIAQVASKLQKSDTFDLEKEAAAARFRPSASTKISGDLSSLTRIFKRLDRAVDNLHRQAIKFDAHATELAEQAGEDIPWWKWLSRLKLYWEIRKTNTKIKYFERQFLYEEGLDGRSWFKHVVFAPGLWTGYAGAVFPGLVEAIDEEDYRNAERWVLIIEGLLEKALESLK